MTIEKSAYLILRSVLFATGIVWVLISVLAAALSQGSPYEVYLHGPSPLIVRLPGIVSNVAMGLLFCVPNRWSDRGYLFWGRLVADVVPPALMIPLSLQDISARLAGETNPLFLPIPLSITLIAIYVALPVSLLWRRRLDRERPAKIGQACGVGSC